MPYTNMLIKVKVFPNSKEKKVIKKEKDSFYIYVKEKPVNNEANFAVFNALSAYFNVPLEKIRIIKGGKERNKIFEIII